MDNKTLSNIVELSGEVEKNYMQIGEDQAHFLNLLVAISGAKNVLEVGCYLGYSAIAMAAALPADGKLITIERKEEWKRLAQQNFANSDVESKIHLAFGEGMEVLQGLVNENQKFDLIFIDADKVNALNYYKISKSLLNPGGMVLVDNVLWRGFIHDKNEQCERAQALRELNDAIHEDDDMQSLILTIGDGIHIARREK